MSKSPKLDEWIQKRPDSWIKDVPKGQKTLEDFKDAFKKEMKSRGKSSILPYLSEDQYKNLFEEYGGEGEFVKEAAQEIRAVEALKERVAQFLGEEVKVTAYKRNGKEIKGYSNYRYDWTKAQERWLKNRATNKDNKALAQNFNAFFKTQRTSNSIRDKKLRLTGRKKT